MRPLRRLFSSAVLPPLLLTALAPACGSSSSKDSGAGGEAGASGTGASNGGGSSGTSGKSGSSGTSGKNGGGSSGTGASNGGGSSGTGASNGGGTSGKNGGGSSGTGASNGGGASGTSGKSGSSGTGASNGGGSSGTGGKNGGGSSGTGASSAAGGSSGSAGGVPGAQCLSSKDCAMYPDRPVCDTTYDVCVTCLTSADCKGSEKNICQDTQCIECLSDKDCVGHANGPHCQAGTNVCTCKDNSECTSSSKGKLCDVDGLQRCGECRNSFDCKNPALPACSFDDVCIVGNVCQGDDAGENADDGPLGATDISPPPPFGDPLPITTSNGLMNRGVCDLPLEEADWYKFTIDNGSRVVVTLDWADDNADLDLIVTDSTGRFYGYNYNGRPAVVTLTHLPEGTYYASVTRSAPFDKLSVSVTPYSINVDRTFEPGCNSTADCASEFATQLYRGVCEPGGECRFIEGNGNVGQGSACDDDKDCQSGYCSYTTFERNAHVRSFCTQPCDATATPPVGCPGNQICTSYGEPTLCLPKCSTDDECYVYVSDKPPPGQLWEYLHCNTATGVCESP
jgi:hypothetical protein